MLYSVLCYHSEATVGAWTEEHEAAVMAKLVKVQEKWAQAGKLGPVARLQDTSTAVTLRKDREPSLVLDGPFAETKEQLLGFYIVDAATRDEALAFAQELGAVNPGGSYEIRPVMLLRPGSLK